MLNLLPALQERMVVRNRKERSQRARHELENRLDGPFDRVSVTGNQFHISVLADQVSLKKSFYTADRTGTLSWDIRECLPGDLCPL